MKGKLILIPTPINEENPLEQTAYETLFLASTNKLSESVFAVEDIRPGRRRWLRWKLPREIVEEFIPYNEHTRREAIKILLKHLHSGKNVYLMSDGGLPAFCDPGRELVYACHKERIIVSSTPHANSISLAIALSGMRHDTFFFAGFLPVKSPLREKKLKKYISMNETLVLMDTPYRMKKLLQVVDQLLPKRDIFLAMDLGGEKEELFFGKTKDVFSRIVEFKREFILVVARESSIY